MGRAFARPWIYDFTETVWAWRVVRRCVAASLSVFCQPASCGGDSTSHNGYTPPKIKIWSGSTLVQAQVLQLPQKTKTSMCVFSSLPGVIADPQNLHTSSRIVFNISWCDDQLKTKWKQPTQFTQAQTSENQVNEKLRTAKKSDWSDMFFHSLKQLESWKRGALSLQKTRHPYTKLLLNLYTSFSQVFKLNRV